MEIENANVNAQQPEPVVVKKKNGMGIAGFVLAVVGFIFGLIPILVWIGWICLVLGLILSIVGMFRKPKGLAIAGLIVSGIYLAVFIILIIIGAGAAAAFL